MISDHLMHLQYKKADIILKEIVGRILPKYILLREIKKEFEAPNHPRLYHDYDQLNLSIQLYTKIVVFKTKLILLNFTKEMNKPEIIAEIGWNHQGDMTLAKKMIKAAKSSADYAKFQNWRVSKLKTGPWDNDGRREIYKKAELTKDNHIELIKTCNQENINFLSSVFSVDDAKMLVELKVKRVKIPSFESRNTELIDYCFSNFEHIYISTGRHH